MSTSDAHSHPVAVRVPTTPYHDQKAGTSGLRKKVVVFQQKHYLDNWVQAALLSLGRDQINGKTLVLGGDGRYWNKTAIQHIIRLCLANGVAKLLIGQNGILSTPAVSAVVRKHGAFAAFILTASHNPGGPTNDFGIKLNVSNGGPAPESITDRIFDLSKSLTELWTLENTPEIDLSHAHTTTLSWTGFGGDSSAPTHTATIEVIDSCADYVELMKQVFDFDRLRAFIAAHRPNESVHQFRFLFDSMNGVTGAYTHRIFCTELGLPESALLNGIPLEDFGGGHPDPNLTYADELVRRVLKSAPEAELGVASDGDGDRNMILGANFFVTPSDSVAIIAEYACRCIPYFAGTGLRGLARSMPTSTALDRVAAHYGVSLYEVPTGWKFFGNLMDAEKLSICGEESFGTGSDHIREKDGIWAVLAWLSILEFRNRDLDASQPLVSVGQIVQEHWRTFGRSYYTRYDYEEVSTSAAEEMMRHLHAQIAAHNAGHDSSAHQPSSLDASLETADSFEYADPIDGSVTRNQGIRFLFAGQSRVVFRLSGTGSSGATIRVYVEKVERDPTRLDLPTEDAVRGLVQWGLNKSKLVEFTGRHEPTVIT